MEYKWLNKKNNNKVIIFFNGWGMDECIVKHLEFKNYDILMLYNYNTLDINFYWETLNSYQERNIIAWSMGVMIASIFAPNIRPTKAIAINGTLQPINENKGIHPKIYDLTIKSFDEKGREKFIKSMFQNNETCIFSSNREIDEQKSELIALKTYNANLDFKFDKIIISNNDKIIPTKSQINFWNAEANIEAGHCPFLLFKNWSELL